MRGTLFLFVSLVSFCVNAAGPRLAAVNGTIQISSTATVCQNSSGPLITFTGSGGTAPYTFTYTINGSTQTITTSNNSSTVTLTASTATSGLRTYALISVSDDDNGNASIWGQIVSFTVLPQPNATITSSAEEDTFNGFTTFKICENQATEIEFFNHSTTSQSLNSGYTIDWGDGSPAFSGSSWTSLSHTYQVGLWTLTYTIHSTNNCPVTKTYKVFVGNNPAVGLGNPGNTDVCIDSSLTFPITGTENNPPGTTYIVSFNDGSEPLTYNHPPPSSVTHTFLTGSCGTTSTNGGTSYQNSFYANIRAINPCDESSATVVPIRISTIPEADFSIPSGNHCINTSICFTNTSTGGDTASSNGCNNPKIVWSVSPAVGFTIISGQLGSDASGNPNINTWMSGSPEICVNFDIPGTYTITMKIGSRCGIDTQTKTICVDAPLSPQFSLNTTSGCSPLSVAATNTTNLSSACGIPTSSWTVIHTPQFCGSTVATIPAQTSTNANFEFSEPGIYTITLTMTNTCGTTQTSQAVEVKKPPTVLIAPIGDICGTGSVTPQASVTPCTPASGTLTYNWTFPGGTPSTSTLANPGPISYSAPGSYTVSLSVTNECGESAVTSENFSVNALPAITTSTAPQTICSGMSTLEIAFSSTLPNTTYSWTAAAGPGVTGFIPGGTSASIPAHVLNNSGAGTGTVTYTVTPVVSGCAGPPVTFLIEVTPAPTISTQPAAAAYCLHAPALPLSVGISPPSGDASYEWYQNTSGTIAGGTAIPGETSATYTPPTDVVGTMYYYVVISPGVGGCSSLTSQIAEITVEPLPVISAQPVPTQHVCIGGSVNTPMYVNVSGGSGTPAFQWFINTIPSSSGGTSIPGATGNEYTPPVFTAPGTYYYYATASFPGAGCGSVTSAFAEVIVLDDPVISQQPLPSQTLCQGAPAQSLEVAASGGIGTFSYQWYVNSSNTTSGGTIIGGATGSSLIPPSSTVGTLYYYCIVSQEASGCSVTSSLSEVIVNTSPSVTAQPASSQVCMGGNAQIMQFSTINGVGAATYQWYSNNENSASGGTPLSGESGATFAPPTDTEGTTWYYCEITFSGIMGDCSTVSTQPASVEVTPGAEITQQPMKSQMVCVGGTVSHPLTVSYTGGTGTATSQWYFNSTGSTTGGTPVGSDSSSYQPPAYASAGNYYYYVTIQFSASGCAAIISDVATVTVVADPEITSPPFASQTLCPGEAAQELSVTAGGGIGSEYTYQWYVSFSDTPGSGNPVPGATGATFQPDTSVVGTRYYYCEVTQPSGAGCNALSPLAEVVVSASPSIAVQPQPQTICTGGTLSPLNFTVINGVGTPSIQWYVNTMDSNTGGVPVPGATSATFTPDNVVVGILYYYAIINFPDLSGLCSSVVTDAAQISIEQNPVISAHTEVICSGAMFNVAPQPSGTDIVPSSTVYSWGLPVVSPAGSVTGATAETNPQDSISQLLVNTGITPATVTYEVTPVAGNCSGEPFIITITVNPAINPNIIINDNLCFGADDASISTVVTGGIPFPGPEPYQYSWIGPDGFTSTAHQIQNLAPGDYSLTISDAGGCPFSQTYTISEPSELEFLSVEKTDVTCYGVANGTINIIIGGGNPGYSFSWTKDNLPFSDSQNLDNLSPGNYEVTVTDANNCGPITHSFFVSEPDPLIASVTSQTNVECFGDATGEIIIGVSGGTPLETAPEVYEYTYHWIGPDGFSSTSRDLTGVVAGEYTLTITDANGCSIALTATITQSPEIIISYTTTEVTCYGASDASMSVQISGGIPPYSFAWSNLSTALDQTNLSAGDYTIVVTDNLNCQKSLTINIPEAPVFTVDPQVSQISCHNASDGSIELNLTGGIAPVTLVWSDGSTAGLTRNGLGPGTYTATITDSKPCQIVRTFVIVNPDPLTLEADVENALDCEVSDSGSIDVLVSGGTPPYLYQWSNGEVTEDLTQITNGNYALTVTDSRGCTINSQYTVYRPGPLAISISDNTETNCETRIIEKHFTAAVSGGVPPYQLQWSSGSVSGINNELMSTTVDGLVVVTATDSRGCVTNYSIDVDIPQLGFASFLPESFGNTHYGIFSIMDPITFASNITGDFQNVVWDFGDGTFSNDISPVHTYVSAGTYIVTQTVNYPFGCQYVQTITLIVEEGYFLVIPTAFSPNDDGLNDNYRPVSKRLESLRMEIYDSWGSMIYSETGDVLVGWNGTLNGVAAENGNYYCTITAKTFYGRTIIERETFVLIK